MIRKPQIGRSRFYDVVHRGSVYTCISLTCLAIFYTGIQFYEAYKFDQRTRVAGKLKHEDAVEALDSKINLQSG